jgi:hypothetical protein
MAKTSGFVSKDTPIQTSKIFKYRQSKANPGKKTQVLNYFEQRNRSVDRDPRDPSKLSIIEEGKFTNLQEEVILNDQYKTERNADK